ncbi:MAG TPA: aldehyde dehydrogenase family protein [Myxococcota bacterium]|nr:aldehyde dehydrogenase family protein [Myxococcota bacterium]
MGWDLRARARGRRVILELGGNASNLVCADADLDAAVPKLAVGGLAYAGQSCISVQNVLVDRARYAELVERLTAYARDVVRTGDPADPAVLCGPVIRAADADRINRQITDAVRGGARALLGGERSGNLIAPTLLVDLPDGCAVVEGEVFGPVINVTPFDTIDEAFARVNASRFGLQASIFTRDLATALRAHAELEVGAVVHDEASAFRVDCMPYGGVKESGLGREGPRHAVLEHTEPRMLVLRAG